MKTEKSYSNNLFITMIWITAVLLSFVFTTSLFSQNKEKNDGSKFKNQISELTQQQRKDLRKIIKEEFDNGTKRNVIREKVVSTLNKWGIQVPENANFYRLGMMNHFGAYSQAFLEKLTKEQRVELRKKMKSLWISGALREDIHSAAAKLMKDWGYDISKFQMKHSFRTKRFERRMAVKGRMGAKHAGGKRYYTNRRKMAKGMMENHFRHNHFGNNISSKLTDNQKEELHEAVMAKRKSNRQGLKEIVEKKLTGWGIEVPENFMNGNRMGFAQNMNNLSNEQRKEVRAMVKDMRSNNASREEIRKAVQNKLNDFGTNNADDDESDN